MRDESDVEFELLKAKALRRAEELVAFFSNSGKSQRERWVVDHFLRNASVLYSPKEIDASEDGEVDVTFRDARFQVKEVVDAERRRGDELKARVELIKAAKTRDDLSQMYTPKDLRLSVVLNRLHCDLGGLVAKYGSNERNATDIVFYVNFQETWELERDASVNPEAFAAYGWRSISFIEGEFAAVLHAAATAPEFLRERQGRVLRWQPVL